jgi:hypothetical protein
MRVLLRFVKSVALYLATVVGGVTLFLIFAPLFGYLPYSDRPGPGWFAQFPALSWGQFWSNAWGMLGYGLFLAILFLIPAGLGVLLIMGLERVVSHSLTRRGLAALVAAVAAGWWMLGAGWYISAGMPLLVAAILLGAIAGGWLIVDRTAGLRAGV